jgi:hypothetical protein
MGAMEVGSGKVHKASTYILLADSRAYAQGENRIGKVREASSIGALEEGSGKVQIASTHEGSRVAVDVAVVEGHVASFDVGTTTLPNKESARIRSVPGKYLHGGDGTLQDLVAGRNLRIERGCR